MRRFRLLKFLLEAVTQKSKERDILIHKKHLNQFVDISDELSF